MEENSGLIQPIDNGSGGKKKTIIIIITCIVLIVAAGIIIYLLTRGEDGEMNENNYQQIQEEMAEKVNDGYFETYMNTEWTFKDGKSKTEDAILGNSPNNKKPIRCEVILDDSGETVLSTDIIPVGAEMPPFKLDKELAKGEYSATCQVYLMDEGEEGEYTDASNAGFHVDIIVQN